jgi:hypothetical protein
MKHPWLLVTSFALLTFALTLTTGARAQSPDGGASGASTTASASTASAAAATGATTPTGATVTTAPGAATAPISKSSPATRRNSTGAMVTGIVLTGVGTSLLVMGLVVAQNASSSCGDKSDAQCSDLGPAIGGTVGATIAVSGGIMALVGIPLIIVGARRVPVEQGHTEPAKQSRTTAPLSIGLAVGPGALSLRAVF